MKDVNKLAGRRLEARELATRDELSSKNERMRDSLQSIIRSSIVDGFSSLQSSSSCRDDVNLISSAAAAMSRKQFRSEEEMHEAQKAFAVTTKLKASGEDVRSVLRINQKGSREYRNKLG
jgi:thioredoxin-like negative regulator of GroEL